ncbi:MAG: shikimate kinase [Clostridiales bacterium]|jgi:shikimate kinase|nr:shikimate kinase [Clostridiales bacterium]
MSGTNKVLITNIVLTGMMGTYKTSAGKMLADRLDMHFMDTDAFFEFEYGMKIADCFKEHGEEAFRDLEAKIVDRVYYFENTVIATGGGVPERDDSMEKLKRYGLIVLLTCGHKELARRLKREKNRPLLKGPFKARALKKIAARRRERYHKYADIVIDNTGLSPAETVDRIQEEILKFYA